MLLSLLALNIPGFCCAAYLDRLEADPGLCELVRRMEPKVLGRSRRHLERRHRGGRGRTFPSPRSLLDWPDGHHDAEAAQDRIKGEAIVPKLTASLAVSQEASHRLLTGTVAVRGLRRLMLDIDATIIPSTKQQALLTYQSATAEDRGERDHQPLNVFNPETGRMVYSEMRDGNVPAKEGSDRVLREALNRLPADVEEAQVRSDGAGLSAEMIRLCNRPDRREGASRRLGVIGFVYSVVLSEELKKEVGRAAQSAWRSPPSPPDGPKTTSATKPTDPTEAQEPEEETIELAEVNFVSNADGYGKNPEVIRYVGMRRALPEQLGLGSDELPPTDGRPAYRIRVLITKIPALGGERSDKLGPKPLAPADLLALANGRCGYAERAHDDFKNGLAGEPCLAGASAPTPSGGEERCSRTNCTLGWPTARWPAIRPPPAGSASGRRSPSIRRASFAAPGSAFR